VAADVWGVVVAADIQPAPAVHDSCGCISLASRLETTSAAGTTAGARVAGIASTGGAIQSLTG
jgi:hypothetical protein